MLHQETLIHLRPHKDHTEDHTSELSYLMHAHYLSVFSHFIK